MTIQTTNEVDIATVEREEQTSVACASPPYPCDSSCSTAMRMAKSTYVFLVHFRVDVPIVLKYNLKMFFICS